MRMSHNVNLTQGFSLSRSCFVRQKYRDKCAPSHVLFPLCAAEAVTLLAAGMPGHTDQHCLDCVAAGALEDL